MKINNKLKIYVAGHNGMVGSAILSALEKSGYKNVIFKGSYDLDLRNQNETYQFISKNKPDVIIDAAARVGGILANDNYPYEFLMDNMLIQNNLIRMAHELNVPKFIFLGSSCIYPKLAPQPLKEEYLLTDSLEPTNQWYAIAKISGVKLIESLKKQYNRDYVSLMPCNLYGPYDNYNLETSHALSAMIRKFYEAKENNNAPVTLWGSGTPMREFLHVNDLAEAVIFTINNILPDHLYNVGIGSDVSIKELAQLIQKIINHKGKILWDDSKPDGTPRKLIDSSKIKTYGWKPKFELENGIRDTYDWFLKNRINIKSNSIKKVYKETKKINNVKNREYFGNIEILKPSCNLETIKDGRGAILTWVNDEYIMEFNMLDFYPNKVRGNHKHPEFTEYFLIVKGVVNMLTLDKKTNRIIKMKAEKGTCFKTPPNVSHSVHAITNAVCISLLTKPWDSCDRPIIYEDIIEFDKEYIEYQKSKNPEYDPSKNTGKKTE